MRIDEPSTMQPANAYSRQRRKEGYAWVWMKCGSATVRYRAVSPNGTVGKRRKELLRAMLDAANMDVDAWLKRQQ